MQLKGKIALITGASRGIGRAVAEAYAKEGAEILLLGRDVAALEAVDDAIQAAGGKASLIPMDITESGKIVSPNLMRSVSSIFDRTSNNDSYNLKTWICTLSGFTFLPSFCASFFS